jgi:hypothetical protein
VRRSGVERYGVVFLCEAPLYNPRMKILSPAAALAAAVAAGCGASDPEAEIRGLLAAEEEAAEARDAGYFGDLVGEGYRDSRGQDRTELLAGVDANLYRFELELVAEGGEWRIIGADVSRALGE